MKGGFNNPPNFDCCLAGSLSLEASMKGGFNNPPNWWIALEDSLLAKLQ